VTPASSSWARLAWPLAFVVVAVLYFRSRTPESPPVETPAVVSELRALARLETARMHVEKVVELRDHQERWHGLVEGDDTILFVATGEVVLGVDLARAELRYDADTRTAYAELAPPEVFGVRFDEGRSHVVLRKTDLLAKRSEGLEGQARKRAHETFEAAAREAIPFARAQAESQLRALARAWGARDVIVAWREPQGEVAVTP